MRFAVPVPPPVDPLAFARNRSRCPKVVSAAPRLFGSEIAVHELALSESNGVFKTAQAEASPVVGKVCNGTNDVVYLWELLIRVGPKLILLEPDEFPSPPRATLRMFMGFFISKLQVPACIPFTNKRESARASWAEAGIESAM